MRELVAILYKNRSISYIDKTIVHLQTENPLNIQIKCTRKRRDAARSKARLFEKFFDNFRIGRSQFHHVDIRKVFLIF